jgi:predicted transcriptional regulator
VAQQKEQIAKIQLHLNEAQEIEEIQKELEKNRQILDGLQSKLSQKVGQFIPPETAHISSEEEVEHFEGPFENGETTQPISTPIQGQQRVGTQIQKPYRPRPLPLQRRQQLIANKPASLRDTMKNYSLGEMAFSNWQKKRLVLIGEDRLMERALSRINSHNILSLPVVGLGGKGVVGLIDILDIIHSLINAINKNPTLTTQQSVRRDFMNRTVGSLFTDVHKPKTYLISNRNSLYDACQFMVSKNQERLLIVNRMVEGDCSEHTHPESDVDGIVTQADALRFLASNAMLMKQDPFFSKSLQELGLGNKKPTCIPYNEIAKNAFAKLDFSKCSGAAVVDDQGKLIANISATDLKGITRLNAPILNLKLSEFLERDQRRHWWSRPICVNFQDSLYQTILQFVAMNIHRMYICDSQNKPIGEIDYADILSKL